MSQSDVIWLTENCKSWLLQLHSAKVVGLLRSNYVKLSVAMWNNYCRWSLVSRESFYTRKSDPAQPIKCEKITPNQTQPVEWHGLAKKVNRYRSLNVIWMREATVWSNVSEYREFQTEEGGERMIVCFSRVRDMQWKKLFVSRWCCFAHSKREVLSLYTLRVPACIVVCVSVAFQMIFMCVMWLWFRAFQTKLLFAFMQKLSAQSYANPLFNCCVQSRAVRLLGKVCFVFLEC